MHPHSITANASLQLRLQARSASAALLRQRLYLWLDELGAGSDEIFDVSLACTEAFANAVEHPHEPTAEVIGVVGSISNDTITDHRPRLRVMAPAPRTGEGGFGFPLMRLFMDRVGDSQPTRGNLDQDGTTTRRRPAECRGRPATCSSTAPARSTAASRRARTAFP